jgi:hypothetical protein
MVQPVGSSGNSLNLFQPADAAHSASGGASASIATFAGVRPAGASSDAATTAISSILDNSQPQAASGDFTNVFQRLSSSLQSLMVQLQSTVAGDGASNGPESLLASSTSTTSTQNSAATTSTQDSDATDSTERPPTSGNWALKGDINAMLDDLHGFIQVANGDATATAVNTGTASTNGNAETNASSSSASNATTTNDALTAISQTADQSPSTTIATDGFAQSLLQALQSYGATNAATVNSQSRPAVSSVS